MQIEIHNIGNSKGVVIPKAIFAQAGLDTESVAEIEVQNGSIVLRKSAKPVRDGWAEAAKAVAAAGDDKLVIGDFNNAADTKIEW